LSLTIKSDRFHWSASWPMTLLTAAAIAAFLQLGLWQWHRAQARREQQAQFDAGSQAVTPLNADNADSLPRYTKVHLSGHYDPAHQFLLENISQHGRPGYEVLTPFTSTDGYTLLVNRGWIAADGPRSQLPDVSLKSYSGAAAAVSGRLDALPVVGISLGHIPPAADEQWPKLTAFPTMSDLSQVLRRPLASRQLLLDPGAADGYLREWQLAGFATGRHLSYAIQWWSFAALALVLYARLNWHRHAT
jgi:surfeit locus 1 family protein